MKIILAALVAALCFVGSASATTIIVKDYADHFQVASEHCDVTVFEVVPGDTAATQIEASCTLNAWSPLGGVAPLPGTSPRFGSVSITPFPINAPCWLVDFSSSTDTIELMCRNWFTSKKQ